AVQDHERQPLLQANGGATGPAVGCPGVHEIDGGADPPGGLASIRLRTGCRRGALFGVAPLGAGRYTFPHWGTFLHKGVPRSSPRGVQALGPTDSSLKQESGPDAE